ncbi:hypothetical protein E0Z10_g2227 [Xylaria hypoxylon]|uniref:Uncharacterized protein n=1 Tax=Xylaria hypoxylon TaxID=37992 RepID=A0A4Z0YRH5_9PEZI|nr:hypothetical protein E0Z10_g2227 [Xylaria hypoxylon]
MASQGKNKTNFKTYEASIRLLAAVIATTNAKLDYAALADLVGEGTTAVALQHRMRSVKQLAKEFTAELEKKNPGKSPEIQKLFGESTPSGIEWQFREIKSLGKAQQEAVRKNENPATLPVAGTPGGRKRGAAASTPGSGATARTPGTGAGARGRKRTAPTTIPAVDSSDENGDNDSDGDFAETPSKRPSKRAKTTATATTTTPKKLNGSVATPSVTPAKTTAGTPTPTPTVSTIASATRTTNGSIFGGGASTPAVFSNEVFHNGAHPSTTPGLQYHPHAANPGTRQTAIKREFPMEMNPFFGAVNAGAFDDFEDGEI